MGHSPSTPSKPTQSNSNGNQYRRRRGSTTSTTGSSRISGLAAAALGSIQMGDEASRGIGDGDGHAASTSQPAPQASLALNPSLSSTGTSGLLATAGNTGTGGALTPSHAAPLQPPPQHPPHHYRHSLHVNHAVSTAAKTSPTFESASAQPVAAHFTSSASQVLRSQTQSAGLTPLTRTSTNPQSPTQQHYQQHHHHHHLHHHTSYSASSIMGQSQSASRSGSTAGTGPNQPSTPSGARPIDAPAISDTHRPSVSSQISPPPPSNSSAESLDEGSYPFPAASEFSRPPRLPLPIQDVDYTPGSPIISPADLTEPIDQLTDDQDTSLGRRASMLSHTTMDEDDVGDALDTVRGGVLPSVPTIFEWKEGGSKIYVTGTFADWNHKYRLHKK